MASSKAKRAVAEDLTQEELAAFDILTKPDMKLTRIADNQAAAMAQGMLRS